MHEQPRVRDVFNLNSRHRRVYRPGRRAHYRDPHGNSAAFVIRPGGPLKKFAKDTWPEQRLELTNLRSRAVSPSDHEDSETSPWG